MAEWIVDVSIYVELRKEHCFFMGECNVWEQHAWNLWGSKERTMCRTRIELKFKLTKHYILTTICVHQQRVQL